MPEFIATPRAFLNTAARLGEAPAYFTRGEAEWQPTSWAVFADQVRRAAGGLVALGVRPGDRVVILAYNRPEWVVADLAIMMAGAVPVGIYFTAAPSEVAFILKDCGAVVLFAENAAQFGKLTGKGNELGALERVVMMEGAADDPWQIGWGAFSSLGATVPDAEITARLKGISPHEAGTLLYTSGTTGAPKAVELSHAALCHCNEVMRLTAGYGPGDRVISYLPLAHIAEKMLTVHSFAAFGYQVYFARSVQELAQHLPEVRPTVFFGVPRVWEKLAGGLRERLAAATGTKAKFFSWAQGVGRAWHAAERDARKPGAALAVQYRLAERLVYGKVKAATGLGDARFLFSGAAPIAPEVLEFLAGLDIVVLELYGQSETCGPTSTNMPGANKIGSVGRAVPGTELRIAEDGEVLVRDAKLLTGYAGRPDATAETLVDGWLHSGDLGRLDADGFLYITGRKKDLIITAGGKNISPAAIEATAEAVPILEHVVVYGDRKPFLAALVTLNPDHLATLARVHDLPLDGIMSHPVVLAEVQAGIDAVNAEQSRVAQVKKFTILPGRFSVETGELTPTLKIKRAVVIELHKAALEAMYAEKTAA
jgi:long-chain acyl-CoA synthetase